MKKNLLTVLIPLVLILACSLGVWANEQSAAQPGCGNCAKAGKTMPCGKTAQDVKAGEGCDKCAKSKPCGSPECENCRKLQGAEGKPGEAQGCDNCVKMQKLDRKRCCDKS